MGISYKGAYGKKVKFKEDIEKVFDQLDNEVDINKVYLVTQYVDREDEIVGIYPIEKGGYTKDDLLSVQWKKHDVLCEYLVYA